MAVETHKVKLPDDLVKLLDVDEETLPREVYKLIIFELFREGRISSGKGAELLGISRSAFLELLAERKIPFFNYSKEDFQEEYEAVKQVHKQLKEQTS